MSKPHTDILVLTDLHYVSIANHASPIETRPAPLARLLLDDVFERLNVEGIEPDAIFLLGDVVDDGERPDADKDLMMMAGHLMKRSIPVFAVGGNHDDNGDGVARAFGTPPGLHRFGKYGLLLFQDRRVKFDNFARDPEALSLPEKVAAENPDLTLIALQHYPLNAPSSENFPYALDNSDEVRASYKRAGVALSLSGHYHRGQEAQEVDGTLYTTAPALVEAPYSFTHLRLEGARASLRRFDLHMPCRGLWDLHCHTEFAYCATSVEAALNIKLAKTLGLAGQGLTEHAFQLYFPEDYAWSWKWQKEPDRVAAAYRAPGRGRMVAYRNFVENLRDSSFVKLGLEVDLVGSGDLLLAPEDRTGWDYLVGAIHSLGDGERRIQSQSRAETLFMRDVERLLAHPVAILAHPFRYFRRASSLEVPKHLYKPVAQLLRDSGKAAELNFHSNDPDPEFFRICLEMGVRISLGTDSHKLTEIAGLYRHLHFLRRLGVEEKHLPRVLHTP